MNDDIQATLTGPTAEQVKAYCDRHQRYDRYDIVRKFRNSRRTVTVLSDVSEETAQAHCNDPETSSTTCTTTAARRRRHDDGGTTTYQAIRAVVRLLYQTLNAPNNPDASPRKPGPAALVPLRYVGG